ncbi:CAP domain-containing protein, partial [Micromonosporaceae bacterium Da 78-11]
KPVAAAGGTRQLAGAGAQQSAAARLLSASRQRVTSSDVSSNLGSPVQQRVLALVNQNRRRGGCGALSLDRRLIAAANEHAADMARNQYFAHEDRAGTQAGDRVRGTGYRWQRYGENIARGQRSPYDVVQGWMRSPQHRQNIMDCRLREMGIGLALSRDHGPYWVQEFATPL